MDHAEEAGQEEPLYEIIRATLAKRIRAGVIPNGLVLIEGPLAELFGTSRAPVRKALECLHREGLAHRFRGRGYLAGTDRTAEPHRQRLDGGILGLEESPGTPVARGKLQMDRMVRAVRDEAAVAMAFGQFRVLEIAVADHFGIGRKIAHEILLRLQEQRILWKDSRGHWMAGPLTARSVRDEYQLRRLLEPAALKESAPNLPPDLVRTMLARVERLMDGDETRTAEEREQVETDLHEECLKECHNERLRGVIRRSQLPLLVNKVYLSTIGIQRTMPELHEHRLVLEHLLRDAPDAAAEALDAHLEAASRRTMQRLKSLSVLPDPEFPAYLCRQ
jgi:DNA-binding GntR family transcriptional regulator